MGEQVKSYLDNMIYIKAGEFPRGSIHSPDESPVKNVKLSPYYIDRTPVTNKEFRAFIETGGYKNPSCWTQKGWEYISKCNIEHPNYWFDKNFNQDDHPVTGVNWWEAMAYAKWAGKTLPTEAQWEYACKGIDQRKYPWGNEEPSIHHANYAIDCDPFELDRSSTSVFAYSKNKSFFGCLDMAGNMAEWCLDNASINYNWDHERINPVYTTSEEEEHIVRGGCGLHNEEFMRCTSRDYYPATMRDNLVGFRCVINQREDDEHEHSFHT